jgi:signal transduction histidine kinase
MNIFRKLRWKLTLNYTIVTVSAFLVVILILGVIVLPRIFVPINIVTPEVLLGVLQKNSNPLWSRVLSQSPVDIELIKLLMQQDNPQITSFDFLRIGSVQFTVRTMADWRGYIIGADGTLLGMTKYSHPRSFVIGQPFDPNQIEGLEAPYNAALAGVTDYSRLYTIYEPEKRFVLALPIIDNLGEENARVVGVIVLQMDVLPTQADVPAHILNIAGRSLLIFLLGIGILGAIFGAFFAHGLSARFKRLSTTIDGWSEGNFSMFIEDTTGEEMAVSEERNRLARDLHDSAKQQALAASFQLGTALTLYDREPQVAKKHLVEADGLLDSVKNELTNLVHELRPQSVDGQDFAETLKEYAADWSHQSGIEININIEGSDELSLETREALFRIAQEALANIARHSSASCADIYLEYGTDMVKLIIKDDGHGFDKSAQHGGLGLYSMRERAEVLGGNFTVESSPDQGTKIVVTLPRVVI